MIRNNYSDFRPTSGESNETYSESFYSSGDIFDLANAFLSISSMTHKKLQKLCYYAKAWYLALYDTNIITEPFEAWVHGAVQPELYQKYKPYGFNYIPRVFEVDRIPEEFLSFSREIYRSYGALSGDDLEELNHSEAPWKNARVGLQRWQGSHNIISEDDMKTFYRAMIANE